MKNLITVRRIDDHAHRIYELPESVKLQPGIVVELENRQDRLTLGVTESHSALVDDDAVRMLYAAFSILNGDFLKVTSVFDESHALWADDIEAEAEEDDD